ncbi:MAG TPA: chemotaxis response regulator protein-glutamate methylesterase [Tissierellia bacterium]|mgnify:CR=1 FL=1|nr:chemotaxis response regulator protein-glutamate methylesterase [Tissierellia bacterium]
MIRVLIVDDSLFVRKVLRDILEKDEEVEVVGEAKNGREALESIYLLNPDVITLDIEMPVMDGLTTLREIIRNYNIPVIMLSSFTKEGAQLTLKALEEGAFDFMPKPSNLFSLEGQVFQTELLNKIKVATIANRNIVYNSEIIRRNTDNLVSIRQEENTDFEYIIAIGTSTGGPRALKEVIPLIPKNINGAFVVVQHMPPKFTKSLADRLNSLSEIDVFEGEDNAILKRGCCYIAPGDFHMRVIYDGSHFRLKLDKDSYVKGVRPSVDVLMSSVAKLDNIKVIGVIMTGMGSDGTKGVVEIKKVNGYIIAQDKESSTVFGMPKSAIETKCVDKIVPLNRIADEIIQMVGV